MTPFEIETAIRKAGTVTGYSWVTSRPHVRINPELLHKSLYRKTPDYLAIRNLLLDGHLVAGAELTTDVVYVLAKPESRECAE